MNINKKDVLWGYISLLLVQGVNALLLPFVLIYLNDKEIGLWYTFTSLYGFAMLIDFGFQTTLSRNISYVWSGADEIKVDGYDSVKDKKININYFITLLSTVKFIYYMMGLILTLTLTIIGTYYVYIISKDELDLSIVLISWFFYLIAIILNIMFSFWNAILRGIGAMRQYNQTLVIAKVSQIIISLILLLLGYGIIGVTFAYLISVIINRVILSRSFYGYSELTVNLKGKIKPIFNKELLKSILPNTLRTGLTSFANYLIINFPIILSAYYLSLEISGQFGIVSQIVTLCLTISNSYFNTYLSKFNYYRVKGKQVDLVSLFKKSIFVNYSINVILFVLVIFLGQFVLDFMKTDKELLPIGLVMLIIIYRFLYNNQLLFVSLLSTKNIVPYYKSFMLSSLVTVSIQIIALNINNSLIMLLLPLLIVQLIHNNWYWPKKTIEDLKRS